MIRHEPPPEPHDFDAECRRPGNAWLAEHLHAKKARDLWSRFKPQLADGFRDLCAYGAMYEPVGTVDHFQSWAEHRDLAYEWSNYRYASPWLNSCKRTAVVLDPFDVGDDWFEILLPSLQLVVTDRVPIEHRELAEAALHRLHLRDDERILRQRREWYRMYREGEVSFAGLRRKAPLIARAIDKAGASSAPP